MIATLVIAGAVALVSFLSRIVLTKSGDPIYVYPRSKVPTLEGGDLYLALKRAGVGVATSPETVSLDKRRSEAIKQLEAQVKR